MASSDPALSIYVHVPFCASKCVYCDFYSVAHRGLNERFSLEARIVTETLRQADYFMARLANPRVESIYVGGGTPSYLSRHDLARLLDAFGRLSPVEWTVEANPESLDRDFLILCEKSGVSRISLGIQANRDRLLALLGRSGRSAENVRALELLRNGGCGEVNLDFLAGIPGQTVMELEEDLALFLDGRIGHVSLYSLTVEPGTELERRILSAEIVPNPEEVNEELWLSGKRFLEARGYRNYEVSNYAFPGRECIHNLRYWKLQPYLGIGPGAVSTLPFSMAEAIGMKIASPEAESGEKASVMRLSNPHSLEEFLMGKENFWGIVVEAVSDRDFLLETLMMGLRTAEGIDREELTRRFGRPFGGLFPGLWEKWRGVELAHDEEKCLRLTEKGRLFLDGLLGEIEERVHGEGLPPLHVLWP